MGCSRDRHGSRDHRQRQPCTQERHSCRHHIIHQNRPVRYRPECPKSNRTSVASTPPGVSFRHDRSRQGPHHGQPGRRRQSPHQFERRINSVAHSPPCGAGHRHDRPHIRREPACKRRSQRRRHGGHPAVFQPADHGRRRPVVEIGGSDPQPSDPPIRRRSQRSPARLAQDRAPPLPAGQTGAHAGTVRGAWDGFSDTRRSAIPLRLETRDSRLMTDVRRET